MQKKQSLKKIESTDLIIAIQMGITLMEIAPTLKIQESLKKEIDDLQTELLNRKVNVTINFKKDEISGRYYEGSMDVRKPDLLAMQPTTIDIPSPSWFINTPAPKGLPNH